MRIIAGTVRRTNLIAPKGLNTRPTSDMAKEGLFNILSAKIYGACFLDLFCGSGAIGLEALSRGAKEAVFIENTKTAIAAVSQNLKKTKLQNAQILEMPAEKAISKLAANGRMFDIIFMDPPYDTMLITQTLIQLAEANLLAKMGIIIAETDSSMHKENLIDTPSTFQLTDTRIYGRTCFLFYQLA